MKRWLLGLVFSTTFVSVASAQTLYPRDTDGLNLRAGPGTEHRILKVLPAGEGVPVVGKDLGWYQVRLPDGTAAWAANWVSRVVYDDVVHWAEATATTPLRAGQDAGSRVVGELKVGRRARLLEAVGDLWLVELSDGTRGWLNSLHARETASPPDAEFALQLTKGVALTVPSAEPRRGAEDGYDPLDRVTAGERLQFLEAAEGWVRVRTPRGQQGWLPGDQVAIWDEEVPFAEAGYYRLREDDWTIAFLPVRQVTDPDGLRLRRGPGLDQEILALMPQGTVMKVLDQQGDWLQVFLADGSFGWAHGAYTGAVGRQPRLSRVSLVGGRHGALTLTIEGNLAGGHLAPAAQGSGLVYYLSDDGHHGAHLPVLAYGVRDLTATSAGVMIRFLDSPSYAVKEASGERLVLEFRPSLESIRQEDTGQRIRFRLHVAGAVRPATGVDGDWAWLELPGVIAHPDPLPQYMQVQETETGIRLRYPSRWPFLLKRDGQDLWWDFVRPGLADKLIVIDPGHGGADAGATAPSNGLREKDVNLAVALQLKAALEGQGARVVLTRSRDSRVVPQEVIEVTPDSEVARADLDWRTRLANQQKADLFLSVHANSWRSVDQGTETFWARGNLNAERSEVLATLVQRSLVQSLGRPDRGVKADLFYVTKYTDAPAALAELAFLSNVEEASLLATAAFQQQAADGLARAVAQFFAAR